MTCLYNENDPKTAAWLRELIAQGHLPAGDVDTRSIEDLKPDDISQTFHAFAGIGGWPLALKLAGWTDADVWTGSCPCQPFSAAGKQDGVEDERHLWPAWFRLIAELRPRTIFGEQVTGAVGHGWLDGVFADMEAEGYRCGAVVLGAHSVGAPHIRQQLFWVADRSGERLEGCRGADARRGNARVPQGSDGSGCSSAPSRVADSDGGDTRAARQQRCGEQRQQQEDGGIGSRLAESQAEQRDGIGTARRGRSEPTDGRRMGDPHEPGSQGRGLRLGEEPDQRDPWSHGTSLIECGDGKARRVEPSIQPLAHGIPARVVRLRGYGNAIVPQVAAKFIKAFVETRGLVK